MILKFAVVPMPATASEKFDEAHYFLTRMCEEAGNVRTFPYFFSAFLSAARSITFYFQKQFTGDKDFDRWYQALQESLKANATMRRLNALRVESVHQSPVSMDVLTAPVFHESPITTREAITFSATSDDSGKIIWKYTVAEEGFERTPDSHTNWVFQDDEKDVVEFSEDCLAVLYKALVDLHKVKGITPMPREYREGLNYAVIQRGQT